MKDNKVLALGAGLVATALLLTACGAAPEPSGDVAPAPGDTVSIYCALPEPICKDVIDAFTAETGIPTQFVRLATGEILSRITAEASRPQASIWFSGVVPNFIDAAGKGLLEPYQGAGIDNIEQRYRDPDGVWTPIFRQPLVFANNEEVLQKNGLQPPQAWEELTAPGFKDLIAFADPGSSGTGMTILGSMVQTLGEDEAFDLLKRLDKNVVQYTKSGAAPATMVGLGEIAVGAVHSLDVEAAIDEGYPIKVTFPDFVGWELSGTALIANAPEGQKEGAKKFIDWLTTENGQQTLVNHHVLSMLDGIVDQNSNIPGLADVELIKQDWTWVGENRDRLVQRFKDEIRRGAEG